MLRSILGFAVLAVVAWFALKLVFGLLGLALTLAWSLVWLAAIGFGVYLLLKLVSPSTAEKVRDMVKGQGPRRAA
jgi:hypothetical protein